MKFQVIKGSKKNTLSINKNSAKKLGIENQKESIIRFGYKISNLEIRVDKSLKDNLIVLCKRTVKRLKVPVNNIHEIKIEHKEIIIGPYIGIYLGTGARVNGWKFERLTSFVLNYEEIKGTVCAFTAREMDFEKLEVDAYYYDFGHNIWKKKRMPFPTVIHRYGDFNRSFSRKLKALYDKRLFNYSEMDKWNELSILKADSETNKYIPDTEICKSEYIFEEFINKHQDIYFKPILGRKGRGIYRIIQKSSESITVITQKNNETINHQIETMAELVGFLSEEITSKAFILQKTIDLIIDKRAIDFRVRFDKDIKNKWHLTIFTSRVSEEGGVVSNRSAGGKVITPEKTLKKYYNYKEDEINKVKKELIEVALKITKTIEKNHMPYGKCAIDLGLDTEGNIYHIESNVKAPNDLTTRLIDGYESLDKACQLNSLYSKRLAGFRNVSNQIYFKISRQSLNTKNRIYGIYFAGSLENPNTLKVVKQIFRNNDIDIKVDHVFTRYFGAIIKTDEKTLVEIAREVKAELNCSIRTILYHQIKQKSKRSKEEKEISDLKQVNKDYEIQINKMKNSSSWKLSKPIRLLGALFKR